MSFTAKDVAELRRITNVGMMKCKEALSECNGNIDEAVNYLRQKGIAGAAKKIANVAAEGIIASAVAADKKSVALVEINCQTDFVAKNDDFIALSKKVVSIKFSYNYPQKAKQLAFRSLFDKAKKNYVTLCLRHQQLTLAHKLNIKLN